MSESNIQLYKLVLHWNKALVKKMLQKAAGHSRYKGRATNNWPQNTCDPTELVYLLRQQKLLTGAYHRLVDATKFQAKKITKCSSVHL